MEYFSGGAADVPAESECPVCKEDLKDPTRPSSCSHVFCRSCLTQSLRARPHCPVCRAAADEHRILPANDVLPQQTTDTQRGRRGDVRDRLQRYGTALPVVDPFVTLSSRRLSSGIHARLLSLQASQNGTPPAPPEPAAPPEPPARLILPTLAPGVPEPPRPRPVAPTPRTRSRSGLFDLFARRLIQTPVGPPTNPTPLWTPPPPTPPSSVGAMAPSPQEYPSSPSSSYSSSDEESSSLDDILFDYGMEQSQHVSPVELLFSCPYCQEGGMDELGLLDHCNTNHRADPRRVVCPICVSLPHGDPTYQSVDFIGHINLRHRYYNQDYMDVTQNEDINEQAVILASYNSLVQNK